MNLTFIRKIKITEKMTWKNQINPRTSPCLSPRKPVAKHGEYGESASSRQICHQAPSAPLQRGSPHFRDSVKLADSSHLTAFSKTDQIGNADPNGDRNGRLDHLEPDRLPHILIKNGTIVRISC